MNIYKYIWIHVELIYSLSNSRRHGTIAEANAGVCWEKHYHVGKKVAHVGFVWHPNTVFQPDHISIGTSFSCTKYRQAHSFPRRYAGNKCPLPIIYNLLIFLLSCRFEWSRNNICRAHVLLIYHCTKNEVFHWGFLQ